MSYPPTIRRFNGWLWHCGFVFAGALLLVRNRSTFCTLLFRRSHSSDTSAWLWLLSWCLVNPQKKESFFQQWIATRWSRNHLYPFVELGIVALELYTGSDLFQSEKSLQLRTLGMSTTIHWLFLAELISLPLELQLRSTRWYSWS